MANTIFQFRRGNTAHNLAFTGANGEVVVDTDLLQLRLHDGALAGGWIVGSNATQLTTGTMPNARFSPNVSLSGNLAVTGNLSVTGLTGLTGNTTLSGFANLASTLQVAGLTALNGNTTITGNTTLSGFANIATTLQVTGLTTLTGNVTTSGFVNVGGAFSVDGATPGTHGIQFPSAGATPSTTTHNLYTPDGTNLYFNGTILATGVPSAISVTDDTSTSGTMYPLWANNTGGTEVVKSSTTLLTWNPGTATLNVIGIQTSTRASINTTSTDGMVLLNSTASNSSVTIQQSPRLRFRSHVWNTTSVAADNINDFWFESVPVSGTTPSGLLQIGSSLNGGGTTYPLTLSSSGALSLIGQQTISMATPSIKFIDTGYSSKTWRWESTGAGGMALVEAGVANQIVVAAGGATTFSATTASTSTTTGSGVFGGGIGVAGAAWIGGLANIAGVLTVTGGVNSGGSAAIAGALTVGTTATVTGAISAASIFAGAPNSGTGTTVIWNTGTGEFQKLSSSKRYKEHFDAKWRVSGAALQQFVALSPKPWDLTNQQNGAYGFIAEDLAALPIVNDYGNSPIVNYNDQGQPDSNRDYALIGLQHLVLQNHDTRVNALEAEVQTLQTRLERLEAHLGLAS